MTDGNVALILDIAGLVRVAHMVDTSIYQDTSHTAVKDQQPTKVEPDQEVFDAISAEVAEQVVCESATPAPVEVG